MMIQKVKSEMKGTITGRVYRAKEDRWENIEMLDDKEEN